MGTSSYQKLKAENKELKQDIYNMVRHENDLKGMETKMKYKIQFDLNDMVWAGSVSLPNNNKKQ